MAQKLRLAVVGGGSAASIGPLHLTSAKLSGQFDLVAATFSGDVDRSRAAGKVWGLPDTNSYVCFEAMLRQEDIDCLAILTPNHLHYPMAQAGLSAGLHILSEKPAALNTEEALALRKAINSSGKTYTLAYTYSAFPMVREARARILAGEIGKVRKVVVQFSQGWLASAVECQGNLRAAWRTDPLRAGEGGASADIGVHAFHLAEYVSGLRVGSLCAALSSHVEGRRVDDDCNVLLHFTGGESGALIISQIALGDEKDFNIAVTGEAGAMKWSLGSADTLSVFKEGAWSAVVDELKCDGSERHGVPAKDIKLIKPFTTLYREFALAIRGKRDLLDQVLPGIDAGLRGANFVDSVLQSSRNSTWIDMI